MWIWGFRYGSHYYVPCFLSCPAYNIFNLVSLLIDTGATKTTLFADRIGLSDQIYQSLPDSDVVFSTMGGPRRYRKIQRTDFHFLTFPDRRLYTISLEECEVALLRGISIVGAGVLGMDIINKFKSWTIAGDFILLGV